MNWLRNFTHPELSLGKTNKPSAVQLFWLGRIRPTTINPKTTSAFCMFTLRCTNRYKHMLWHFGLGFYDHELQINTNLPKGMVHVTRLNSSVETHQKQDPRTSREFWLLVKLFTMLGIAYLHHGCLYCKWTGIKDILCCFVMFFQRNADVYFLPL